MAVRGQLLTGNLKAEGVFDKALIAQSGVSGLNFPSDPNSVYNFSRSFQTVEGLLEFNFRDYKLGSMKKSAFTPFVALGIGVFYSRAPRKGSFILDPTATIAANPLTIPPVLAQYPPFEVNSKRTNGFDVQTLTIPVGAGFKFNFSKRLGGLVEVIVRKTFNDNIDNLNDPVRFQGFTPSAALPTYADATKRLNKNDYYATLAFSLTWQLWSDKGNCAIYDKIKNKK